MIKIFQLTLILLFTFVLQLSAGEKGDELLIDLGDGITISMVRITAAKEFYIGKYELTQGQWTKIMGNNPSNLDGGQDFPVENVSWKDICGNDGFLEKINALKPSGYSGFRLPTEAEWEYAYRAGTQTRFYFGEDASLEKIGSYAWYAGNSGLSTHAVGRKKPNAFGLYDMSGNVSEWCADYSKDSQGIAVTEPAETSDGSYRVTRGGTCESDAKKCGASNRFINNIEDRFSNTGFRLALTKGK